jgi:hypothetical protein
VLWITQNSHRIQFTEFRQFDISQISMLSVITMFPSHSMTRALMFTAAVSGVLAATQKAHLDDELYEVSSAGGVEESYTDGKQESEDSLLQMKRTQISTNDEGESVTAFGGDIMRAAAVAAGALAAVGHVARSASGRCEHNALEQAFRDLSGTDVYQNTQQWTMAPMVVLTVFKRSFDIQIEDMPESRIPRDCALSPAQVFNSGMWTRVITDILLGSTEFEISIFFSYDDRQAAMAQTPLPYGDIFSFTYNDDCVGAFQCRMRILFGLSTPILPTDLRRVENGVVSPELVPVDVGRFTIREYLSTAENFVSGHFGNEGNDDFWS